MGRVGEGSFSAHEEAGLSTQSETPPPCFDEVTNKRRKKRNNAYHSSTTDVPPLLPHRQVSHLPSYCSNSVVPFLRTPSQAAMVSKAERERQQRLHLDTRHLYFTHHVIRHLDDLLQVVVRTGVDFEYKVTDSTHRLLYTVTEDRDMLTCDWEENEVRFQGVNAQRNHVFTITKYNTCLCGNYFEGEMHVKLQPDIPLGSIRVGDETKALVKNCSGDTLCKIVPQESVQCLQSPTYWVIPARRHEEFGRIVQCRDVGFVVTFPRRAASSTKTILMSGCVLMLYKMQKAKKEREKEGCLSF